MHCDVIGRQEIGVDRIRRKEHIAAVRHTGEPYIKARGGGHRAKQHVNILAVALTSLQSVAGVLILLSFFALFGRDSRGYAVDVLDLSAAEFKGAGKLLVGRTGIADGRSRSPSNVVVYLQAALVLFIFVFRILRPKLLGRLFLVLRIKDEHPWTYLMVRRHPGLFPKSRHAGHGRAYEAVLFFHHRRGLSMKRLPLHSKRK